MSPLRCPLYHEQAPSPLPIVRGRLLRCLQLAPGGTPASGCRIRKARTNLRFLQRGRPAGKFLFDASVPDAADALRSRKARGRRYRWRCDFLERERGTGRSDVRSEPDGAQHGRIRRKGNDPAEGLGAVHRQASEYEKGHCGPSHSGSGQLAHHGLHGREERLCTCRLFVRWSNNPQSNPQDSGTVRIRAQNSLCTGTGRPGYVLPYRCTSLIDADAKALPAHVETNEQHQKQGQYR
mmetsp:Transcript_19441/g.54166  ORF Transcript_19441/g.54166 Transcript_19441/m.54166 type:complete len:237 (-) Transcript_19441:5746-6456(-)